MRPTDGGALPIEEWADDDLVAEFRRLKAAAREGTPNRDGWGTVVEAEMNRRGLQPDREDLIPDDPLPELEAGGTAHQSRSSGDAYGQ